MSVHNRIYVDMSVNRMNIPSPGQTVHLMDFRDVLRVWWDLYRNGGRNVRELDLYTTDDLRRLYQATNDDPIRLRDGIVSRVELVAVIRWRLFWARSSSFLLLVAAVAGVIAAVEGWK
jgi:hypothetical protein